MRSLILTLLLASFIAGCTSPVKEPEPCQDAWAQDTIRLQPNSFQFTLADTLWSTRIQAPWTNNDVRWASWQNRISGTVGKPYVFAPESGSNRRVVEEHIFVTLSGTPTIQKVCNRLEYHYPMGEENTITFVNDGSWVGGNYYFSKHLPQSGTIVITELDSVQKYISGKFAGQLVKAGGSDTIHITGGLFYRVKMWP